MGGHAKCLRLMTRGEGGGSKIPKTRLRNTWMFPCTPKFSRKVKIFTENRLICKKSYKTQKVMINYWVGIIFYESVFSTEQRWNKVILFVEPDLCSSRQPGLIYWMTKSRYTSRNLFWSNWIFVCLCRFLFTRS